MSRPTQKADLLQAASAEWDQLWKLMDSMSEEEQNASFVLEDRDRKLRDVLVHLYEWHRMVENWHRIGTLEGGMPDVPGKGYTWKTLPELNRKIWEKHQGVPLGEAKAMLQKSHEMILRLIESHTQEELFSKGIYQWTKSSTLGSYFVSCTSSHYDWAIKKIKKQRKASQEARS